MNSGILYATFAFFCWGLFPLYFHAIGEVPPQEILAHRMLWSLLFLVIVLTVRQQWGWLPKVLRQPRVLASFYCFGGPAVGTFQQYRIPKPVAQTQVNAHWRVHIR